MTLPARLLERLRTHLIFSTGFRHYIRNTLWLFVEKLLATVAVLVIGVWIARYLGPADFGKLSFAQSLVALFSVFATLGLVKVVERDLVPEGSPRSQIVNTSVVLVLAASLLLYGSIVIFLLMSDYEAITRYLIAIVGMGVLFQVNSLYTAYFYSQVRARKLVIATVLTLLVSNAIKIIFILSKAPLLYFAVAIILDSALLLPVLLFVSRDTEANLKFNEFSLVRAKNLLSDSWPFILSGFMATVYLKIDTIMIKEMAGDYSAGQYAAATRLSEGLYYIPITLLSSIYPAIVNAKSSSQSLYDTRLSSLYSLLFFLSLAISLLVGFFNTSIINVLYGSAYADAASVLFVHVWSCVFIFIGACSSRWLLTENLQVLVALNTFLGASLNIALNLFLIPEYGIVGAAWATLISYGFVSYFSFVLWKRTRLHFALITRAFFTLPKINW